MKDFYKTKIMSSLVEAGVEASEELSSVISKLKSINAEKDIIAFVKSNWSIEKLFLPKFIESPQVSNEDFYKDPAIDFGIEVERPSGRMRMVDNWMYKTCPNCEGRLFKGCNFCPFCGIKTGLPEDTSPIRFGRGLGRGFGRGNGEGRGCMKHRLLSSFEEGDVIIEDENVGRITKKDVDTIGKDINKYIP